MPQPPGYWFGNAPVPAWARALAGVYGAVIALRRRLYRMGVLRRHRVGVPVIVVGNIIAGGTGKTPLTIALVKRLPGSCWPPVSDPAWPAVATGAATKRRRAGWTRERLPVKAATSPC